MKYKELKVKGDKELAVILGKTRDDLQTFKFKVAARQQKDVREIRVLKKLIAEILTLQKERAAGTANLDLGAAEAEKRKEDSIAKEI